MRVAVTGAAGRIGTKVVALLVERGHFVVAIDKNGPTGETVVTAARAPRVRIG